MTTRLHHSHPMSLSTLDILYIVLSFCVLWFTAAVFWFFWQLATSLRNVNKTISDGHGMLGKIEKAITGVKEKFDSASSLVGLGANTAAKSVEYVMEKKKKMEREMAEESAGSSRDHAYEAPSRKPAYKKRK